MSSSNIYVQGMDGSTCKPANVHDTDYMVEKTYRLPPAKSKMAAISKMSAKFKMATSSMISTKTNMAVKSYMATKISNFEIPFFIIL